MRKLVLIFLVAMAVAAGTLLARTDGPPPPGQPFSWKGKWHDSLLSISNVLASPSWTPANPLPLSMDKAVEIARGELRKVAPEIETWTVIQIALNLCVESKSPEEQIWYYHVKFV